MPRHSPHGFTLIELMVVVAIIGVLASIAVPQYQKFDCRAKQTEAKTMARSIADSVESYVREHDSIASAISVFGGCSQCSNPDDPEAETACYEGLGYADDGGGNMVLADDFTAMVPGIKGKGRYDYQVNYVRGSGITITAVGCNGNVDGDVIIFRDPPRAFEISANACK